MKIAIIGPAFPLRGGIADFNEALAYALEKENHEVELFSFSLQYPSILFPGKSQKKENSTPPQLSIHSTINSVNPLSWNKTAKAIDCFQPDLIIVRFWIPFMGPALGSICKKLKKKHKIIAITDNVIPHESKPGDKPFTKYFLKQCHGFITMSSAVKNDLKTFLPQSKITVAPHPIYNIFGNAISKEEARKLLNWDNETTYFLFFGLVRKYKGLDLLLDALALVKDKNWKLCIAGEFYDQKQPYLDQIEKFGLSEQVVIHDRFIEDDAIKNYFCAADWVTQTYKTATQSGVAQIAYQFNAPLIVTDVGGLAEIVPHNKAGLVAKPNAVSIAEALEKVLEQPSLKTDFLPKIIEEKKKYEWSFFTKAIFDLKQKIDTQNDKNR